MPEYLASSLGFAVHREPEPPRLPGIVVFSEYQPDHQLILLYTNSLTHLASRRGESFTHLEQWHIAHELFHGLAESVGLSPWDTRETDADQWADRLMALVDAAHSRG